LQAGDPRQPYFLSSTDTPHQMCGSLAAS
jgi:hypothetical protein